MTKSRNRKRKIGFLLFYCANGGSIHIIDKRELLFLEILCYKVVLQRITDKVQLNILLLLWPHLAKNCEDFAQFECSLSWNKIALFKTVAFVLWKMQLKNMLVDTSQVLANSDIQNCSNFFQGLLCFSTFSYS